MPVTPPTQPCGDAHWPRDACPKRICYQPSLTKAQSTPLPRRRDTVLAEEQVPDVDAMLVRLHQLEAENAALRLAPTVIQAIPKADMVAAIFLGDESPGEKRKRLKREQVARYRARKKGKP